MVTWIQKWPTSRASSRLFYTTNSDLKLRLFIFLRAYKKKGCQRRGPPAEQTRTRWWPCWLHPQPLWWRWGCFHRRWQHPPHSAPARSHWCSSWSWKTERVKGSSSPHCLQLRPSNPQPPWFIGQMGVQEWRGRIWESNPCCRLGWVGPWALGPTLHPVLETQLWGRLSH